MLPHNRMIVRLSRELSTGMRGRTQSMLSCAFHAGPSASSPRGRAMNTFLSPRQSQTCEVVGIPFAGGQPKLGLEEAPNRIRQGGLVDSITELGWDVVDIGDVTLPEKPIPAKDEIKSFERVKNPRWVGQVCQKVADTVHQVAKRRHFPLVLGGDHSIALGSVAGVVREYPNLGVLWVDAHADINCTGSTPSGNMHGMPISFLMGLSSKNVPGFEWLPDKPPLGLDQLVYIGLRDLEHAEKEYLRSINIKSFDMHDVDRYGIGQVMDWAMKIMGDRPLHISFDIDSLDPQEAPSTGTPVRGGLTFREGTYICEYVHSTKRLVSMDMVEINPALGDDNDVDLTVRSGISMIRSALGETLTHRS